MKEIIFSFILYMLYDAYMRQREKDKFVTQDQLSKAKLAAAGPTVDWNSINSRITALEQSNYA